MYAHTVLIVMFTGETQVRISNCCVASSDPLYTFWVPLAGIKDEVKLHRQESVPLPPCPAPNRINVRLGPLQGYLDDSGIRVSRYYPSRGRLSDGEEPRERD